jgi:hypothetical protein
LDRVSALQELLWGCFLLGGKMPTLMPGEYIISTKQQKSWLLGSVPENSNGGAAGRAVRKRLIDKPMRKVVWVPRFFYWLALIWLLLNSFLIAALLNSNSNSVHFGHLTIGNEYWGSWGIMALVFVVFDCGQRQCFTLPQGGLIDPVPPSTPLQSKYLRGGGFLWPLACFTMGKFRDDWRRPVNKGLAGPESLSHNDGMKTAPGP